MHNLNLFYCDKVSGFVSNINEDFYTLLREWQNYWHFLFRFVI
jgi:hypothetical protein